MIEFSKWALLEESICMGAKIKRNLVRGEGGGGGMDKNTKFFHEMVNAQRIKNFMFKV